MLSHAEEAAGALYREFSLDKISRVVEVASNDGYFLKNFKGSRCACLGIEPAKKIAKWRKRRGSKRLVNSLRRTWRTAEFGGQQADLILANNVFAHAPHPNDFVSRLAGAAQRTGRVILEFPYAADFIEARGIRHYLSRTRLLFQPDVA